MRMATNLKLTLSFDTKILSQVKKSKAHLIITNILNVVSMSNSVFSYFDGVRLKNKGTKGQVLDASTIKNIVWE